MSSELERRLGGMLAEAPEPERGAGEEALRRALRALHPSASPHRGLRTAVLVFAAAVVLLAIAAGSLAAAGALHVSFGAKAKHRPPATTELTLPNRANGIAAIVDGRLSVVVKGGFRLQGQEATAVALSPHALYIAAGIGRSLVAMAPDGRRAWSHPAGGKVVAASWAPDGLEIAYVVRHGRHLELHLIYGNGRKDTTIDRSVRAVRPSWRADSLAFAYVAAGGKAIVYDVGHTSRRVVASRAAGDVRHVAFAPGGKLLALATSTAVGIVRPGLNELADRGRIGGIGWTGRWLAVVHEGSHPVVLLTASPQLGQLRPGGTIDVLGAEGHGIALAVSTSDATRVLAAASGDKLRTVMRLPPQASVRDLQLG